MITYSTLLYVCPCGITQCDVHNPEFKFNKNYLFCKELSNRYTGYRVEDKREFINTLHKIGLKHHIKLTNKIRHSISGRYSNASEIKDTGKLSEYKAEFIVYFKNLDEVAHFDMLYNFHPEIQKYK